MSRRVPTNAQWAIIERYGLGKSTDPGQTGRAPGSSIRRSFGSFASGRSGALPDGFGKWNSVFKRRRGWVKADSFPYIFKVLTTDADLEYAMIDGPIVKVHRSAQGAKGGSLPGHWTFSGGHNDEDAGGDRRARQPRWFCLMPGQAPDLRETDTLARDLSAGHLLVGRAFDADYLRNDLLERGIIPAIPPKSKRKFPATFDKQTCKWRHLIESDSGSLKENRGRAMRSCKTAQSFKAFLSIAATIMQIR